MISSWIDRGSILRSCIRCPACGLDRSIARAQAFNFAPEGFFKANRYTSGVSLPEHGPV